MHREPNVRSPGNISDHGVLRFTARAQGSSQDVNPGVDFSIIVSFRPNPPHVGQHAARVKLRFEDTHTNIRFSFVRSIRVAYGDLADHEQLRPSAPFVPPRRGPRPQTGDIVWATRPPRYNRNPYKVKLGEYPIPQELSTALEVGSQQIGQVIDRLPPAYRPRTLEKATYTKTMTALIWIEEYKAKLASSVLSTNCTSSRSFL